MGSTSAPLPPSVEAPSEDPKQELLKQIRSHEVALAELNFLPSNRVAKTKYDAGPSELSLPFRDGSSRLRLAPAFDQSVAKPQVVYHRNGNLFFRKDVKAATALEQKQLDSAKARLQKMSAV